MNLASIRAMLGLATPPWAQSRRSWGSLALMAALSVAIWQATELLLRALPHPRQAELVAAAEAASAAQQEIVRAKERLGLMQSPALDPNRTGLIGPEWSEIATTIGDLPAKRTVTNPDAAATIARTLLAVGVARGKPVGLVLSGSFVGANVAAIAAVEALAAQPIIVSSVGASMYGATDPALTWLDMEAAVAHAGIWKARSSLVVLGGESALGSGLSNTGREMLIAAAHRNGHEPLQGGDFAELKRKLHAALLAAAPDGLAALVSSGGSVVAMGTCLDAYRLPSGLLRGKLPCTGGVPGLIHDFAERGVPVVHILNIRSLALELGLPFDPIPLPTIGQNARVYGRLPVTMRNVEPGVLR